MSLKSNSVILLVFAGMFYTSADALFSHRQININFNGNNILLKSTQYPIVFEFLPYIFIGLCTFFVLAFIKTLIRKDSELRVKEVTGSGLFNLNVLLPIIALDVLVFAIRLALSKNDYESSLGFHLTKKDHPLLFNLTPPLLMALSLSTILYFLYKHFHRSKAKIPFKPLNPPTPQ
jgi:hypothetical protein